MCEIFGVGQSWWSVAGLTLDIIGFLGLAFDLTSDVKRSRNLERWDGVVQSIRNVLIRKDGYTPRDFRIMEDSVEMTGVMTDLLADEEKVSVFDTRLRFIWPAIALIIMGFILQIVGSWPC